MEVFIISVIKIYLQKSNVHRFELVNLFANPFLSLNQLYYGAFALYIYVGLHFFVPLCITHSLETHSHCHYKLFIASLFHSRCSAQTADRS